MNMMAQDSDQVKKENILNFTFGAPLFGNKDLEEYARKKELSRCMFPRVRLALKPKFLNQGSGQSIR